MRSALPAALLLVVLGTALPAEAEWLVLVGGKKIQTEGPWTLKGDLLTVHETTGRILTVATNTVDAAACLKVNGGSLRIEAIATPAPPGAPVTKPEVAPVTKPETAPASAAGPPRGDAAAKPAKGKAPAKGAAASAQATPTAPAASGTPAAGAAAPTPGPAAAPAGADRVAAAKQAKQAQLQRELRHKQIVDGCATMFIVDRAGFQHCVDVQTKASPR
jgi:hypothetical protein